MKVLVIGGTGMLGRPVVRRLVEDGIHVRAMVRDLARAAALLPDAVELVRGDVRETPLVAAAMEGVEAAYLSLNNPFSPKARYDPDRDGTFTAVKAAERVGLPHLLRLSALGTPEGSEDWWVIDRKRQADDAVMESRVPATVFRGDWFMESLPLFMLGPFILRPATRRLGLHWIAGDDYARQVSAALTTPTARDRIYAVQGPTPFTFKEAIHRFARAFERRRLAIPLPLPALRILGPLNAQMKYGHDVIRHAVRWTRSFCAQETWDELGAPTMSIEEYVASMHRTGDTPRKPLF